MKNNILSEKSYKFALRIVKLYKFMIDENREYVLSKQILRSGTSIGANIEESIHAQSKTDFIHKLSISRKETNETIFWLDLLKDTFYLEEELYKKLINQANQILKILTSIILTSKKKLNLPLNS